MSLRHYLMGVAVGTLFGISLTGALKSRPISNVQEGYVPPSRVLMRCEDNDSNGELETILRFNDVDYLLRDVEGVPVISSYEVESPKIVYEE